jgi:hypothetical protein
LPAPQSPWGSIPAGTKVQCPGAKGITHEWQAAVHGESQHTPSTQLPLAHVAPSLQA